MLGVDATTFQPLGGLAHVRQSIVDIIQTQIGERVSPGDVIDNFGQTVSIREYGARHHRLVDEPINGETILSIIIDVYNALMRWDPRVFVREVRLGNATAAGEVSIVVEWIWLEGDQEIITTEVTL